MALLGGAASKEIDHEMNAPALDSPFEMQWTDFFLLGDAAGVVPVAREDS